jgi:hypothetical protein
MPALTQLRTQALGCNCVLTFVRVVVSPEMNEIINTQS